MLSANAHYRLFDGCGATRMHGWPKDNAQDVHDIAHLIKLLYEEDVSVGKHGHWQHPNCDRMIKRPNNSLVLGHGCFGLVNPTHLTVLLKQFASQPIMVLKTMIMDVAYSIASSMSKHVEHGARLCKHTSMQHNT